MYKCRYVRMQCIRTCFCINRPPIVLIFPLNIHFNLSEIRSFIQFYSHRIYYCQIASSTGLLFFYYFLLVSVKKKKKKKKLSGGQNVPRRLWCNLSDGKKLACSWSLHCLFPLRRELPTWFQPSSSDVENNFSNLSEHISWCWLMTQNHYLVPEGITP